VAHRAVIANIGFNRFGIEVPGIAEYGSDDRAGLAGGGAGCGIGIGYAERALPQVSGKKFFDGFGDNVTPDAVFVRGVVNGIVGYGEDGIVAGSDDLGFDLFVISAVRIGEIRNRLAELLFEESLGIGGFVGEKLIIFIRRQGMAGAFEFLGLAG